MPDYPSEVDAFLQQHPEIEIFEVILPDLAGGLRGKWLSRDKLHKAFDGGLKLPLSTLAFDSWGRDPADWVFDSGDKDGICRGDVASLARCPWLPRPTGQLLLSMEHVDGTPCRYDPRNMLHTLMDRFASHGLTPVLASEMEFHLLQQADDEFGRPLHTQTDRLGGSLQAGQTYGINAMQDQAELMHAIRDACTVQNLPIDTLIKEAAPSQYEINLYHSNNALLAADHALLLRRAIQGVARQQGLRASFMAKPFAELAGNGMHVHCSLLNQNGDNAFSDGTDQGNELLRQAIAGCLQTMPDCMLLFAPTLNSYRRFQRGSHAPLAPTWGYENRTVSVRVPADKPAATRIEHRVAGADANGFLVIAAILAGMMYGIEHQLEAPPAVEGNAYDQFPASLPRYWPDALRAFAESEFIAESLGREFQAVYTCLKQQEIDECDRFVTALEYQTGLA